MVGFFTIASAIVIGLLLLTFRTITKKHVNPWRWALYAAWASAIFFLIIVLGQKPQPSRVALNNAMEEALAYSERIKAEANPDTFEKLHRKAIEASVLKRLKDPDSAKFGNLVRLDSDWACVAVNSRNSYGGYTGEHWVSVKKAGQWNVTAQSAELGNSLCQLEITYRSINK